MLSPHDLVVLGDCNPDVLVLGADVTPAFGQQQKLVGSISLVIGGSAAITAVAAARLGLGVALVAAVGADRPGEFMLDQPAAEAAAGPRLVVKLGERGALCADGPVRQQVSLPPVLPVDATGAGDCFNAGLIAGLLGGLALPEAAALGCAVGALSTGAPGGTAGAPDMPAAARLAKLASVGDFPAERAR